MQIVFANYIYIYIWCEWSIQHAEKNIENLVSVFMFMRRVWCMVLFYDCRLNKWIKTVIVF